MVKKADIDLIEDFMVAKARESFYHYRLYMNPAHKVGWFYYDISMELQQFYEDFIAGKRPKLVIQAPPQHGKSEAVVDFISWVAGKNPDLRTIYGSFSEFLGVRANLRLQRIYETRKYQKVFPKTKINKSNAVTVSGQYLRNRNVIEYVDQTGFFRNTTVRGSVTGESLDLGVIDDPIKGRIDASSRTVRDAAWSWMQDDFGTRFSEFAALLMVLTRWHIDDPVGRLIKKDKTVRVISYEAIAETKSKYRNVGEALFPEFKSLQFLLGRKNSMVESSWASLYQQRPTLEGGELFKPDEIKIVKVVPHGTKFARGWDFASTTGGDYSASVKLGVMPDGRFLITNVTRERKLADERDKQIKMVAQLDTVETAISIPQDPGQAGKSQVVAMTKLLAGFSVHSSTESGDKTSRAEPFAAQVNVGNVVMLEGDWNEEYIEELRHFPQSSYDDQVDASSRVFNFVTARYMNGLFDFELPTYEVVPITLYTHVLRIQLAKDSNGNHSYSLIGYCYDHDTAYLLDAGKFHCAYSDLADNVVKIMNNLGANMMPRESFAGIVLNGDANIALVESLREHKKLNNWGGFDVGVTPKYKDETQRANESFLHLQQGKLEIPVDVNRYSCEFTDISQFKNEFSTFNEDGTQTSDGIINTVIWEVVTQFGEAPRTKWR
jgi:predicted phage terminase large subunit-like protein